MTPQANRERKMLIINPQMESKESIKEAGKVQLKRKKQQSKEVLPKDNSQAGRSGQYGSHGQIASGTNKVLKVS